MDFRPLFASFCAVAALAACTEAPASDKNPPTRLETFAAAPSAAGSRCWDKHVTPAETKTVRELVQVQPARLDEDGNVISEPIYRREAREVTARAGREQWFETPCEDQLTPEFLASLQRALKARGHYSGAITGRMDTGTGRAIRLYQEPQGLDSTDLVARRGAPTRADHRGTPGSGLTAMPLPTIYRHATRDWRAFLDDAKQELGLGSDNMAYTAVQAVLLTFRRHLTPAQGPSPSPISCRRCCGRSLSPIGTSRKAPGPMGRPRRPDGRGAGAAPASQPDAGPCHCRHGPGTAGPYPPARFRPDAGQAAGRSTGVLACRRGGRHHPENDIGRAIRPACALFFVGGQVRPGYSSEIATKRGSPARRTRSRSDLRPASLASSIRASRSPTALIFCWPASVIRSPARRPFS